MTRHPADGRRRPGVLAFLVGAAAGLGSARLFAPRSRTRPDVFGPESGRGTSAEMPTRAAVRAGYEPKDASAGDIAWVMALFAGTTLAAIGLMAWLLHGLHGRDAARDAGLTRLQRIPVESVGPHLQADPIGEIAALRARQYDLLHTTARLSTDTARIPIDRAMSLMVGQKLDRPDTQGNGRSETAQETSK